MSRFLIYFNQHLVFLFFLRVNSHKVFINLEIHLEKMRARIMN